MVPVRRKVGAPSGQADTYPLTSGWDTQTARMQARWTHSQSQTDGRTDTHCTRARTAKESRR
eukprot:1716562-Prymnesium_polylepis.2